MGDEKKVSWALITKVEDDDSSRMERKRWEMLEFVVVEALKQAN